MQTLGRFAGVINTNVSQLLPVEKPLNTPAELSSAPCIDTLLFWLSLQASIVHRLNRESQQLCQTPLPSRPLSASPSTVSPIPDPPQIMHTQPSNRSSLHSPQPRDPQHPPHRSLPRPHPKPLRRLQPNRLPPSPNTRIYHHPRQTPRHRLRRPRNLSIRILHRLRRIPQIELPPPSHLRNLPTRCQRHCHNKGIRLD